MFEIGGLELLIILLVALVVLGPEKLPDATLSLARAFNKIKKNITLFQRALFTEIALKDKQEKENKHQGDARFLATPKGTADTEKTENLKEHEKLEMQGKVQNPEEPAEENKK